MRHRQTPVDWSGQFDLAYKKLSSRLSSGLLAAILGNRGTGKTQLACELVRKSAYELRTALYIRAFDLFDEMLKDGSDTRQRVKSSHLLVIDELAVRNEAKWNDNLLSHIVDTRYASSLDTILISNQTEQTFISAVGTSIASRLSECGGILELTGKSRREAR